MTGTLRSIAGLIRNGDLTLSDCATRLGISREQLEDRLRLMERQGYVFRCGNGPVDAAACTCSHCCSSCTGKESQNIPATFSLTAKGERLLRPGTTG